MNILANKIRNNDGAAAASSRSWEAYMYAVVANVSKLKGLSIKVIGNSLIISIAIKILIKNTLFLRYGIWTFVKVLNFEYPKRYALSSMDWFIFKYPDLIPFEDNAKNLTKYTNTNPKTDPIKIVLIFKKIKLSK